MKEYLEKMIKETEDLIEGFDKNPNKDNPLRNDLICWYEGKLTAYKEILEEYKDKTEELENELDALNMRYLSQVSLWKSRYEEAKCRLDEKNK